MHADYEPVTVGWRPASPAEPAIPWLTLSRRTAVVAAIASLHALIISFLISMPVGSHNRPDPTVLEAKIIAFERPPPDSPPPILPVVLQASPPPIDLPTPRVAIEIPAEQPPATRAITAPTARNSDLPVVATEAPPAVDSSPVVGPRPIAGPRASYPKASVRARESGTVEMILCVSPKGTVDSVQLAGSSGSPRLDHEALGIASEYRFQPATRHGQPIAACAHFRIVFKVT